MSFVSICFVSFCFVSICFVSFRFVSFRFDLFRFVSICFVSFRFVSFRSVSFRFDLFRFVSICFVSFRFVSVSFRTLQGPLPLTYLMKIFRDHVLIKDYLPTAYQVWSFLAKAERDRYDLWPTDLNINRDHVLIKDHLPTKFDASWAKPSGVISCAKLRETNIPTYRPTCAKQYALPSSKGA